MAHEKILIIEDEKDIVKLLKYNLEKEGYVTASAFDGSAGLNSYQNEKPDLIILDIMLPKMDGFELLKTFRKDSEVPVLVLTAKKDEVDRILGLELGADDFLTKPFSVRELVARVKSILRRTGGKKVLSKVVRSGELVVDLERYECQVRGVPVPLSPREFEFLKCLFAADGKAITREQLLERVWGYDQIVEIDARTVDQHISRLRQKLGVESKRLITVKNVGYRLQIQ